MCYLNSSNTVTSTHNEGLTPFKAICGDPIAWSLTYSPHSPRDLRAALKFSRGYFFLEQVKGGIKHLYIHSFSAQLTSFILNQTLLFSIETEKTKLSPLRVCSLPDFCGVQARQAEITSLAYWCSLDGISSSYTETQDWERRVGSPSTVPAVQATTWPNPLINELKISYEPYLVGHTSDWLKMLHCGVSGLWKKYTGAPKQIRNCREQVRNLVWWPDRGSGRRLHADLPHCSSPRFLQADSTIMIQSPLWRLLLTQQTKRGTWELTIFIHSISSTGF